MIKSYPCSCCECQGIKCLVYHPGHSCKVHDSGRLEDRRIYYTSCKSDLNQYFELLKAHVEACKDINCPTTITEQEDKPNTPSEKE